MLFNTGDSDLEKFVEIGTEDAEKFHSLDQRLGRVLRFLQNAAIEFEPAQLAINEILRIAKTLVRGLRVGYRYNRRVLFRFGPRLRLCHICNIDN